MFSNPFTVLCKNVKSSTSSEGQNYCSDNSGEIPPLRRDSSMRFLANFFMNLLYIGYRIIGNVTAWADINSSVLRDSAKKGISAFGAKLEQKFGKNCTVFNSITCNIALVLLET
jgi:hypothetical protein